MKCQDVQMYVDMYVDGEFDDERECVELELHIEQCPECAELVAERASLKRAVKRAFTPDVFRDGLMEKIEASIATSAEVEEAPVPNVRHSDRRPSEGWKWVLAPAVAAAAALMFVIFGAQSGSVPDAPAPVVTPTTPTVQHLDRPAPIVAESVSWHRRNVPVEVVGPNDRQVKRWFDNKVDFPVRLPSFAPATGDVSLLGARLSNVEEKQAAYVIYQVDGNKVSVLMYERGEHPSPARGRNVHFENAGGYNVAVLEEGGVTYSITSNLPRRDMVSLVQTAFETPAD